MKREYDSPEFEFLRIDISNQIMNPSVNDEEPVPGGPGEDPIEE